MDVPISVVIAFIGLLATCVLGVIAAVTTLKKDARADGKEHGNISQKLDNMLSMLTEVKKDMSDMKRDTTENRERVIRLEIRVEQAEKCIEEMKEEFNVKSLGS